MKSQIKFASLVFVEIAAAAALVACGGGSTDMATASTSDMTAQSSERDMQAQGTKAVTLTVTATAGGTVVSTPAGISCKAGSNTGCSATFDRGTSVSLAATSTTGYTFSAWGGDCSGSGACSGSLRGSATVSASFTATQDNGGGGTGDPVVSYTDTVAGPVSGGENNLGAYLSIFGSNLGTASGLGTTTKVYIGDVEVANYRGLTAAKVATKLGTLQQINVQVGNLGLPLGQAAPIKVVVNGVSSNITQTFTPNPGRVLFVSLTGNDATAVANDINHPWRHLQTSSNGGVGGIIKAGDQVVIRGGEWSDLGLDNSWFRFRYTNQQGNKPTGAANTGWIHFTAYPGPVKGNAMEDVHYKTPANTRGGIQGANSAYFGTTGDYVAISNLRMEVDGNAWSDAAPVNLQYSAGPWRVVNNELGPWPSKIVALAAGVSGHGNGTVIQGNNIHDIACSGGSFTNHGIYADSGASNWDVGYNWIHDITGGNMIQFFDNVGLAGQNYGGFPANWTGFVGMKIHHNWMENGGRYGLNIADGSVSAKIWNNVVKHITYAGLRLNVISKNMDMTVAFNTFYDNDRTPSGSGNGQVLNSWGNYGPTGTVRVYDNIIAAGPSTLKSSNYYVNAGATDTYFDFKRNLYFDNNYGWNNLSRDPIGMLGDPKFKAADAGDLSLTTGSPAINNGTQAVPFTITDDFTRRVSRPAGGYDDLGAYERLM